MYPIETLHHHSFHNREAVAAAAECGCYFCGAVFAGSEVESFTDGGLTAMCPHCLMDSVVPGATDPNFLAKACDFWFVEEDEMSG